MTGRLRTLVFMGLGALAGFLLFAFHPVAHALPEYATRTGEPCSTCHVNPAGGGPRTMRGSLWIAAGRPDTVPPLPGSSPEASNGATSGAAASGPVLYEKLGCGGCHGVGGEGGAGPALNRGEIPANQLGQVIRNGKGTMMGFKATAISEAELAALVQYMQAMGRGEVKAPAKVVAPKMEPARVTCSAAGAALPAGSCGGN